MAKAITPPPGFVLEKIGNSDVPPPPDGFKMLLGDPGPTPSYSPIAGMSENQKLAAGAGAKAKDYALGLKQIFGMATGDDYREKQELDAPLMSTLPGQIGSIGADIGLSYGPGAALKAGGAALRMPRVASAGGALMMPANVKQGMAVGAMQQGLSPAENMVDRGENIGFGLGVGGTAGFLPRLLSPKTDPNVVALKEAGIRPTVGQTLGGTANRIEEAASSIPILGDMIKASRRRPYIELNEAAYNRVLTPIGEKIPKDVAMGREAVDYTGTRLSQKYNAVLSGLDTKIDPQFVTDLQTVRAAASTLPDAQQKQLDAILKSQISGKFRRGQGGSMVDGETMKGIESELGRFSRGFRKDQSFDTRELGERVTEIQDALRSLVMRSNPQKAKELQAINEGWANFKRVQRAAVAGDEGVFTPAQLSRAVKATDPSKDKSKFAKGEALMQDLSDPGKAVLSDRLPDSGTPYRGLAALVAGGAAGSHFVNPWAWAVAGAVPALYNPLSQRAAFGALTMRPQVLRRIGDSPIIPALSAPAITTTNEQLREGRKLKK